jgi:nuclear pore complex protein Nup133
VEKSSRVGERNIVAATLKGRFHAWRIHRGGHHDTLADAELREAMVSAVQAVDSLAKEFSPESFELLDFTFVPNGLEEKYVGMSALGAALGSDNSAVQHLLVLVSLSNRRSSHYSLVEVVLSPEESRVGMVRPISSYTTPASQANLSSVARPRLHLPRPALVAFLVFDRAVVVASIAVQPESPESQLQEESHILPPMYEDVVDLRDDNILEIVGSGFEESPAANQGHDEIVARRHKTKNPSAVLIVKGAGVLRITTTDVDKFASDKPPKVTAKSKLEQAVFFGIKTDNPLVFDGRIESQFSHHDIAEAALQLSHEILSSTSPHVGTLPASMEDNLNSRVQALERLILHLRTTGVTLDRRTRWMLLWNAEKMTVSTLLWKRHETFTTERPANDKKSLVAEIVEFIHEDQKKDPNKAVGEVDRVRHWFINDVWRLELFVAWAYEVIKYMYKDHLLDDIRITRLLYEAVQLNICALMTGWEYRTTHLADYGLGDEDLEMNILRAGYEGLPEPWTGSYFISNNIKRLVELCNQWLNQYYPPNPDAPNQPDPILIDSIVNEMPALTDLYLTSLLEQSRWGVTSSDPKKVQWAQHCGKVYKNDREEKATWLAKRGQWDEGVTIAEKHRCWHGLAVLMIDHIQALNKAALEPNQSPAEAQQFMSQIKSKEKDVERYCNKYGEVFAFEVYDRLLETDGVRAILDFAGDKHGFKTKFLRTKPELARISWINDIERENDIDHAAETLLDLGLSREQQVWNKKIELSLGKLALLAEAQSGPDDSIFAVARANGDARHDAQLDQIDRELGVIKIQDQLYSQVFPTVSLAVDETAELDLAMETHAKNIPKKQKALMQTFENGMRRLLKHEALDAMSLIDLLTLIWLKAQSRDEIPDPFYLALLVAENSLKGDEFKQARRLIWRRCYIRDDWSKINDTQLKDDPEVVERLSDTALFYMLVACYSNRKSPLSVRRNQRCLI